MILVESRSPDDNTSYVEAGLQAANDHANLPPEPVDLRARALGILALYER